MIDTLTIDKADFHNHRNKTMNKIKTAQDLALRAFEAAYELTYPESVVESEPDPYDNAYELPVVLLHLASDLLDGEKDIHKSAIWHRANVLMKKYNLNPKEKTS